MKTMRRLAEGIITLCLVSLLLPSVARANCLQDAVASAPVILIDATRILNSVGSFSQVETTRYPGLFKCSAPAWGIIGGKNTVDNSTPYSRNTLYLKFPGDAYVSLNISGLTPQETHPKIGTNSGASINASFSINLSLLKTVPNNNIMVVHGDTATINPIVLAQDSTGLTILQNIARMIADFAYFIFNWSWPQRNYDIFYQPLMVKYIKTVTTCSFDDANKTVVLNNIDMSSLASGNVAGKKDFTLNFTCANFIKGTTSRNVRAFLSSSYLLAADSTTLISPAAGSAGGVGIRVGKAGENIPFKISPSANAQGNATSLFSYSAGQTMEPKLSIPMNAWYYVYNRQALSSGPVKTTAVVNFVYD